MVTTYTIDSVPSGTLSKLDPRVKLTIKRTLHSIVECRFFSLNEGKAIEVRTEMAAQAPYFETHTTMLLKGAWSIKEYGDLRGRFCM
jgi:hypothetical protein